MSSDNVKVDIINPISDDKVSAPVVDTADMMSSENAKLDVPSGIDVKNQKTLAEAVPTADKATDPMTDLMEVETEEDIVVDPDTPKKRKADTSAEESFKEIANKAADTTGKTETTTETTTAADKEPPNPTVKKRKTTASTPKTPKDGAVKGHGHWTPEEESTLMTLVKENPKVNSEKLAELLAEKDIIKLPGAITNKKRRLKASTHEWTEGQIEDIKTAVEQLKKHVDPYLMIADSFLSGVLGKGVKREAAVKKIRELEKEGILDLEGVPGFKRN